MSAKFFIFVSIVNRKSKRGVEEISKYTKAHKKDTNSP